MHKTTEHSIVDLVQSYGIVLKKQGSEWVGKCPFHSDTHASLKANPEKNIVTCFAGCGGWGYKKFQEKMGDKPEKNLNLKKPSKKLDSYQIIPVPSMAESPDFNHYEDGMPSKIYRYEGLNGELLGFVCRFDKDNGDKEVRPFVYGYRNGRNGWFYMGYKEKRPLYGLARLKNSTHVIVVEGEKTADYLNDILPSHIASITSIGGSSAALKSNWNIVKNKIVVIWPDHDGPGLDYASDVLTQLVDNNTVGWLHLKNEWDKGFDAADTGWSDSEVRNYINTNTTWFKI